ncbi:hypothetical protein KDW_25510 [Dictyobacter vulcani]|uniref:HdeD family acid-resistance protein n=1 Tax=Dictyobacter vulcani TaxID=2607529 RepID=A0A5J4KQI4_9CHLR|nr:HdeD family acid-resistance protein [Dictyobacter vulcani]GER88389.1 hypothetical protein KDW_25510 [Dictyobacter vulcani]
MESQFASVPRSFTATPWWMVMIEGIALFIVGLLLLFAPATTTILLVQILGWFWLISGIMAFVSMFIDRNQWGLKAVTGVLGILAGIVVIRHPLWSALMIPAFIVVFLAVQALITGLIQLYQGFKGGGLGVVVLGVVNIIFGIILLTAPLIAARALPLVLGIFAVIAGVATFASSFRLQDRQQISRSEPSAAI